MTDRQASRSAAIVAAHRAMESARPSEERICFDPLAEKLIGPDMTVIGASDMPKAEALKLFRAFVPGFHEYFLARTRYIDDCLQACLARGLRQLVVLGAGYDSRAYRFEALRENVAVFEVDHPETQRVKKAKLEALLGGIPAHVAFVPFDFKDAGLAAALFSCGYRDDLKTLFIWEGVTMYLDAGAVDRVIAFAGENTAGGSALIFDFTSPAVVQGREKQPEAIAWHRKTADSGEPLRFGITLAELTARLKQKRFSEIRYVTHADFKRDYFSRPRDPRTATPILTIAHATMAG